MKEQNITNELTIIKDSKSPYFFMHFLINRIIKELTITKELIITNKLTIIKDSKSP